jgi:hypothetical protein
VELNIFAARYLDDYSDWVNIRGNANIDLIRAEVNLNGGVHNPGILGDHVLISIG